MIKNLCLFVCIISLTACTELANIGGSILEGMSGGSQVTSGQAALGLKEALSNGVTKGANMVSMKDGFFKNQAIKILFPQQFDKIQNALAKIPGGKLLTDNLVEKLNRAAEDASKSAKPVFLAAVKGMTFNDAMSILMGGNNLAATEYLKKTTTSELYNQFSPVVKNSLMRVKALNAWTDVVTAYNKIPFVEKLNPSIDDYVTNKAIDGLFHMVGKEEQKIRKDPLARTSDLLKKVFAAQDKQ